MSTSTSPSSTSAQPAPPSRSAPGLFGADSRGVLPHPGALRRLAAEPLSLRPVSLVRFSTSQGCHGTTDTHLALSLRPVPISALEHVRLAHLEAIGGFEREREARCAALVAREAGIKPVWGPDSNLTRAEHEAALAAWEATDSRLRAESTASLSDPAEAGLPLGHRDALAVDALTGLLPVSVSSVETINSEYGPDTLEEARLLVCDLAHCEERSCRCAHGGGGGVLDADDLEEEPDEAWRAETPPLLLVSAGPLRVLVAEAALARQLPAGSVPDSVLSGSEHWHEAARALLRGLADSWEALLLEHRASVERLESELAGVPTTEDLAGMRYEEWRVASERAKSSWQSRRALESARARTMADGLRAAAARAGVSLMVPGSGRSPEQVLVQHETPVRIRESVPSTSVVQSLVERVVPAPLRMLEWDPERLDPAPATPTPLPSDAQVLGVWDEDGEE